MSAPVQAPIMIYILAISYFLHAFSLYSIYAQEIPAMVAKEFTLPPIGIDLGKPAVALENWATGSENAVPNRYYKYTGNFVDCSDTAAMLCNQGAWADFGLAVSGLIAKYSLCTKYSPSTSCISTSLTHCNSTLGEITKTMMIAFGRVVVSWCYDGGFTLTALDSYATCLGVAMFDSLTIRNCLTQINDPRSVGNPAGSNDLADPHKSLLALSKLFNNVIDTYQSSTIVCIHSAIEDACGEEAAKLALGPAMDELMLPTGAPPSSTHKPENTTDEESEDIYSRSRQYMQRDYSSADTIGPCICLLFVMLISLLN